MAAELIRAGHGYYSTPKRRYWVARCAGLIRHSHRSVEDAIEQLRDIVGPRPALIYTTRPCR